MALMYSHVVLVMTVVVKIGLVQGQGIVGDVCVHVCRLKVHYCIQVVSALS